MTNPWLDFIAFLDQSTETEYGDFKREADLHLRNAIERSRPLTVDQRARLLNLRSHFLWLDHENDEIPRIKNQLRECAWFMSGFQNEFPGPPQQPTL